ncbi:MAG: helix-turn-helix transcriptional regulator [Gallionellaceae bacterium]|jgi:transcriptional regulator with XRE-family HTH domain|nr:helix-turn-helix transcriptional regulator [Gallionellaceae bacterium]
MNDSVLNFPIVLRRLREARNWSQERLAEHANLNRSYLGEVERGSAIPSLSTASKLACALEIPLSLLIAQCESIASREQGG